MSDIAGRVRAIVAEHQEVKKGGGRIRRIAKIPAVLLLAIAVRTGQEDTENPSGRSWRHNQGAKRNRKKQYLHGEAARG